MRKVNQSVLELHDHAVAPCLHSTLNTARISVLGLLQTPEAEVYLINRTPAHEADDIGSFNVLLFDFKNKNHVFSF